MELLIKIVYLPKILINRLLNRVLFLRKNVEFAEFPKINGLICLKGRGKLSMGKNVVFNSSLGSNPIGGDTKMIIDLGVEGSLYIGDNTGISNAAIIAHQNVFIGKNVKIGGSVKIYDTDFHSLLANKRANPKTDIAVKKPIKICDNTFIGAHSIILKGVVIGKNSIVGAGSVVSKSIPENEIWAGNPAKLIRKVNVEN